MVERKSDIMEKDSIEIFYIDEFEKFPDQYEVAFYDIDNKKTIIMKKELLKKIIKRWEEHKWDHLKELFNNN